MGHFNKGLLALAVAVLPMTANAYDTHKLTETTFEYLRDLADQQVERTGLGKSMEKDGLTYIFGSYETDAAKIGHATTTSYTIRNREVAKVPANADLQLDTANRCIVTGITRGEAILVELLTQRHYGAEGKWNAPKGVDPSNTHTSTEIFKDADYDRRCKRMKAHADEVVMMRTDEMAEHMKGETLQLHGATRGTPYTGVPAPKPLLLTTPDAANINAAPEVSVKAPVAMRAFEAVDTIVSLPEKTILAFLTPLLAKFAPWLLAMVGFIAAAVGRLPKPIIFTGSVALLVWAGLDIAQMLGWIGGLFISAAL